MPVKLTGFMILSPAPKRFSFRKSSVSIRAVSRIATPLNFANWSL